MPSNPAESVPPFHYPGLDTTARRRFEQFAAFLADEGRRFNLTTILEPGAIYLRHFADALQALDILDTIHRTIDHQPPPTGTNPPRSADHSDSPSFSLADIGSGAGLPGLALAIARPNWTVTTLEATAKKVAFQQRLIDRLGLANARAIHGRAEQWAHDPALRESFHAVTARALASLEIIAELALPLLRLGGRCIAYKTTNCDDEIRRTRLALEQLGGRVEHTLDYSVADLAAKLGYGQIDNTPDGVTPDGVECPTGASADVADRIASTYGPGLCLIVIKKTAPTDPKWPRPWKQIKRRPIAG